MTQLPGSAFVVVSAVILGLSLVAAEQAPSHQTTFTTDVAPIIFEQCTGCHRPDGPGPFTLLTYRDVRQRAVQIAQVTKSRIMPPWKPEPGYGSFVGARRLSNVQIEIIQQWVVDGTPEGDPTDLPPSPTWNGRWLIGQPDLVLRLPEFELPANGPDLFRNFVVPVPVNERRFVRGLELQPGSSRVHHANIRLDYTPASRELDEADPKAGYEGLIPRSAGYPDGHFLGWTPGQMPPLAPRGLAWRLDPGSDLVVQLHLEPSNKPDLVTPAIGIFFTNDPPGRTPAMLRLGEQGIDIRPGESQYVITDSYVLPVDVEVHAVQPHAHNRAREVKGWVTFPDGRRRWLIYISRWDFHWQDVYRYEQPFWIPRGSTLSMEYTYDNSADNPRNPDRPPLRVRWGQSSADEMGDLWLQVLTRNADDLARLNRDFRRKVVAEDIIGYEVMLESETSDSALHDDVALLYMELGQPTQAAHHFAAALRLRPDSATARFNLGTALSAAGKIDEALARYRDALQIDPGYTVAHNNLGNLLLTQGALEEAGRHLQAAVDTNPDYVQALNNLAYVLIETNQHAEAIEHATNAIRLNPNYAVARFNLARALISTGKVSEAVAELRRVLELQPDFTGAALELAWLLATHPNGEIRKPVDAVSLAEQVATVSERKDPRALDVLAAAYASADRLAEAIQATEEALALLSPNDPYTSVFRDRLDLYRSGHPFRQPE